MGSGPVLNPALDQDKIAASFAHDSRVLIRDVLTQDSAALVYQCLKQEIGYTPMHAAHAGAQDGLYDGHVLSRDGEAYPDPSHYLSAVTSFLNSAPALGFARAATGNPGIAFADAQATRYQPGHFLNPYDGGNDGSRIAAYVLHMTPRWRPDWGGALLFSDSPGHISGGYLPTFNTLNILAAGQAHWVGLVAPFAGAVRYAITGWFRTR